MIDGYSKFYEFPDLQRIIDMGIGIALSLIICYVWQRRVMIKQKFVFYVTGVYVVSIWVQSDCFSILCLVFLKTGHSKLSEICKKQAFRTIGTVPLLTISHELGHKDNLEEFDLKKNCKFCKLFSF